MFSIYNTDPLLHIFTFAMKYPQLQCNTDLLLCEPILLVLIKIERLYSFTRHFTSSICNLHTSRFTFYVPVYLYIFRHLRYNTDLRLRIGCGSQCVCVCRLWQCVCVCRLWQCVCVCRLWQPQLCVLLQISTHAEVECHVKRKYSSM